MYGASPIQTVANQGSATLGNPKTSVCPTSVDMTALRRSASSLTPPVRWLLDRRFIEPIRRSEDGRNVVLHARCPYPHTKSVVRFLHKPVMQLSMAMRPRKVGTVRGGGGRTAPAPAGRWVQPGRAWKTGCRHDETCRTVPIIIADTSACWQWRSGDDGGVAEQRQTQPHAGRQRAVRAAGDGTVRILTVCVCVSHGMIGVGERGVLAGSLHGVLWPHDRCPCR